MADPQIVFPKLHAGQQAIYDQLGQRNVIRAGRRFGKSTLLEIKAARQAIEGKYVGWFAPIFDLTRESYSRTLNMLDPIIKRSSKNESIIELITGGSIKYFSLENVNVGRSRKFHHAIVDEAGIIKTGLEAIVEQAIRPTLLDYNGMLTLASTPKGDDFENYFAKCCLDKKMDFKEFYAPTEANPHLSVEALEEIKRKTPPLVYSQEYLAQFVDFRGANFFKQETMMQADGTAFDYPVACDYVFACIDTALKTGSDNDGTAVVYAAFRRFPTPEIYFLDWEIDQIESDLLINHAPNIFARLDDLSRQCKATMGSMGVFVEEKASGITLLQSMARRGMNVRAIDSKLTSWGKDERAISVSGYFHSKQVHLTKFAEQKSTVYKGQELNHFIRQLCGFVLSDKDAARRADDLLDAAVYCVALALGNGEGY